MSSVHITDDYDGFRRLLQATMTDEYRIGGKIQSFIDCPYCGKPSTRKDTHASFGKIMGDGWGFKCFVCGKATNMNSLASQLDIDIAPTSNNGWTPKIHERENVMPSYMGMYDVILAGMTASPSKYSEWRKYREIPESVVDRYSLGVGVLPSSSCRHMRLVAPIGGVMFRGRRIHCNCAKWTQSGGVSPYDMDLPLVSGIKTAHDGSRMVWVTESYIDAICVSQFSDASGVATLSTSYWCDEWTRQLKKSKPTHVVVAFDADISGNGCVNKSQFKSTVLSRVANKERTSLDKVKLYTPKENQSGWIVPYTANGNRGEISIPAPSGVKLSNMLKKELDCPVVLFRWNNPYDDIGNLWMSYVSKIKGES